MSRAERLPLDQAVRDRVTRELGTTFLLEASAGTGKTHVLVERYVSCVLDPEAGSGDVRTVAAITFTEKAAGELRQRVRERFEQLAGEASPGTPRATLLEQALEALDDAPIHTIHGFAARLLREFPVEAGVDPAFEQLDALAGELEAGRLWETWLAELAAGESGGAEARGWLARLLRAGVRLDTVRELALGSNGVFGERYDLEPILSPPPEPDLAAGLAALAAPLESLRKFCVAACSDPGDKGCRGALDLVECCERLLGDPAPGLDDLAARLLRLPVKSSAGALGGRQGSWRGGGDGKTELWDRYSALGQAIAALRDTYATFVTGLAVAVADAFSRWAGAAQLALGHLDFTDLLGCLRDLLAGDLAARAALQQRFDYILVDEFQDTDPLQAEIVFYLCEREPVAADWRDVVLEPGKLFVVGDPKQSIYRFRRADIALYDEVKGLVGAQPEGAGAVEVIRQNFRTTPALVEWANRVFEGVFGADAEPGRQPHYEAVEPYRPPAAGPRVAVLLGREYAGRGAVGGAEQARRDEARALAALLVAIHDGDAERWRVQDRGREAQEEGSEPTRVPRWSDVALLFRATTGLETYEQALREAGVPYRVEGGKTYFTRREVADALLCLRAVDDPGDGPALYGALHSSLFGFSDDELFLFWAAGGVFDVFAARQPEGHEAVAAAMALLRELHRRSRECEPHELIAELVRRTHAAEFLAATGLDGGQAIANLEKLAEQARAFASAGGGGLGAFLPWAAEAGDTGGEQESQVDDEADVVHLSTIHKAKGLEYPIVVLVGGARAGGGGGRETVKPIVDRAGRRLAVKFKAELSGGAACDLEPRAYTAINEREKEMAASELRRLLYVAATRARDRLVVSCFGKLRNQGGEPAAGVLLGGLADSLPAAGAQPPSEEVEADGLLVLPPGEAARRGGRDATLDASGLLAARDAWRAERAALLERARRPAPATSPSALEHVDDEVRAGGPGAPPGRTRALALGAAVHRVMELCDLADDASLPSLSAAVAAELGHRDLAEPAAELARACWRAAPVRAAAASPEVYRELPVGVLLEGVVLGGSVDLLYRDGGEWVVVDFKTDRAADAATLLARYTPQGAAYAVAVEAATGRVVREVVFIAPAAGGLVVTVPVDEALRALVAGEVSAALREGRAIGADELGETLRGDERGGDRQG
jgi:ATP-dependent helicase/nuclease subunit A